ncbi:hypothetical protein [Paenibacillus agilis]|uniref:Uncharacterized protein n=1 Tax=Paenibacillus agilis TaxID=3020863 RepID=A0A559IZN6_9BACL|nr:hypothetical protein [Paenibacillus agilis]TVX93067.1 hypothetical protein FPZ44_08330 [Paenibacillus agilis]
MNLIVPVDAAEIIKLEYSRSVRSRIIKLVEQGYILANEATRHVSFLNWDLGKRHEGYLRPLAINYLFKKDIEQNLLPLSYSYEFNKNKSHKYLVFQKGNVKMTLSQTSTSKSVARPAFFRDKLQETNQIRFNLFNEEMILNDSPEYYMLLTYSSGGETPRFINIGMPGKDAWIEKVNLLSEPHLVQIDGQDIDKEEVIQQENLIGLKQFVKEVEEGGGK